MSEPTKAKDSAEQSDLAQAIAGKEVALKTTSEGPVRDRKAAELAALKKQTPVAPKK